MKVARKKREKYTRSDWRRVIMLIGWIAAIIAGAVTINNRITDDDSQSSLHPSANSGSYEWLQEVSVGKSEANRTLHYTGFTVYFNPNRHLPNCVVYELLGSRVNKKKKKIKHDFEKDDNVPECASPRDYAKSGWQRGHMAPAADFKWNRQALHDTYYMTNICPQAPALNQGMWNRLEQKVRQWAKSDSLLIVFTGPIFKGSKKYVGDKDILVPNRFFKVILAPASNPVKVIAFIMPNGATDNSLMPYTVSVAEVERETGLTFFPRLNANDAERLKTHDNAILWFN